MSNRVAAMNLRQSHKFLLRSEAVGRVESRLYAGRGRVRSLFLNRECRPRLLRHPGNSREALDVQRLLELTRDRVERLLHSMSIVLMVGLDTQP